MKYRYLTWKEFMRHEKDELGNPTAMAKAAEVLSDMRCTCKEYGLDTCPVCIIIKALEKEREERMNLVAELEKLANHYGYYTQRHNNRKGDV